MGKKLYLIGPYPPPLGGISVYVYRFCKQEQKKGLNIRVIDFNRMKKIKKSAYLLYFLFKPRKLALQVNGYNFYLFSILFMRLFPTYIVFYDHSGRSLNQFGKMKKVIFNLFINKVDELWLVGEHLKASYTNNGYVLPEKTIIKNAFLPPPLEDEQRIDNTYDSKTRKFLKTHQPLIIANAYQIVFNDGVDLYGLDMCIELVARLKPEYPDIGLLFALAELNDQEYFNLLTKRIKSLGISDHIFFMTGQKELWPLFKQADLMVRPTYSDGYGISIAEALYFGCPAVASNVCERPEGTVLFRNRDLDDLVCKCTEVIKDLRKNHVGKM